MIVHAVSFGSVWLANKKDPRTVWNTTGVQVRGQLRPRAQSFGLVRLPSVDAHRVLANAQLPQTRWHASRVSVHNGARTIHLHRPAEQSTPPDWFLAALTNAFVGRLGSGSWDRGSVQALSFSECGEHQEVLLLVRAFGWVRGASGCAVLVPTGRSCTWQVTRW